MLEFNRYLPGWELINNYGLVWDFINAHLTYINRERRINSERVEGINDLLNFTIENAGLLVDAEILDDLREITGKLLRANSETWEVADDKLQNVTSMIERIEIEVDVLRAGERDVQ